MKSTLQTDFHRMFSCCLRLHAQWAVSSRFEGVSCRLDSILFPLSLMTVLVKMMIQHQVNPNVNLSHQNCTKGVIKMKKSAE